MNNMDRHGVLAVWTGVNSGQARCYRFKGRWPWFKFENFAHVRLTPYFMPFIQSGLILPTLSLARIALAANA
jgi:hypothetical protein